MGAPTLEKGREVKYIDGFENLKQLCKEAEIANYNRQPIWGALEERFKELKLAKDTRFPITFHMLHNDSEIRTIFSFMNLEVAKQQPVSIPVEHRPEQVQLDMSITHFLALPEMTIE